MLIALIIVNLMLVIGYLYFCSKFPARLVFFPIVLVSLGVVYFVHVALTKVFIDIGIALSSTTAEPATAGDGGKLIVDIVFVGPAICLMAGASACVHFIQRASVGSNLSKVVSAGKGPPNSMDTNPYAPPHEYLESEVKEGSPKPPSEK
jgi:hypothetical protein